MMNSKEMKLTDEDCRNLASLVEVFATFSINEVVSAFQEAKGDPNRTGEILISSSSQEDQSTFTSSSGNCSSSSGNCIAGPSSSSTGSSDFGDTTDFLGNGLCHKSKSRSKGKMIASAGIVSTVLGKEYMKSTPNKVSSKKKGFHEENCSKEEMVQFLHSMFEESELGLAVVAEVFDQCGYDLQKALNVLLEFCVSSEQQSTYYPGSMDDGDDAQHIIDSNDNRIRTSSSTSRSESELQQNNVWFKGNPFRGASKASRSSEPNLSSETGSSDSGLAPQKVLESLFNMCTPKTAEHEPNEMRWNVVKQFNSPCQRFDDAESSVVQSLQGKDWRCASMSYAYTETLQLH